MTYKVQIDDLVRDATPAEIAEIEARAAEPTLEERTNAIQQAKQSARVKLAAIGLSEAEINALVGQ